MRKLIICTLVALVFTQCDAFDPQLKDDLALESIKSLREAEKKFFDVKGRYGTLEELREDKLIREELRDGSDRGYRYELEVGGTWYTVNADPLPDHSDQVHNHFFLDDTGVIRASNDSRKRANKNSEAIRSQ